jgi:hypothetical protein
MARAVLLLIVLVAARAKAGAVENARAEEQRDKREAIVRDNCIIRDWERWILKVVNNKETLLIMCHHSCNLFSDPFRNLDSNVELHDFENVYRRHRRTSDQQHRNFSICGCERSPVRFDFFDGRTLLSGDLARISNVAAFGIIRARANDIRGTYVYLVLNNIRDLAVNGEC